MSKIVLATGGAGTIGSHAVVELLAAGYGVVILDNFENAERDVVRAIERIGHGTPALVEADVRDGDALDRVFRTFDIDVVIHFAGKKAVAESVDNPLLYYDANIRGATTLFDAMTRAGVANLIFSSSATVYGTPVSLPIDETAPTAPMSPYGRTKLVIEQIIDDLVAAEPVFGAISLRYFNPVGAHRSGLIGENPRSIPNNLFPLIASAAAGESASVRVFGSDYPTPDGTGLRDFIHVVDLARGHVAAVRHLLGPDGARGHRRINLGTGRGYTVLEAIEAFSAAAGRPVPYELVARRPGDIAASVADPSLAARVLGWRAEHGLAEMCEDHWRYAARRFAERPRLPLSA